GLPARQPASCACRSRDPVRRLRRSADLSRGREVREASPPARVHGGIHRTRRLAANRRAGRFGAVLQRSELAGQSACGRPKAKREEATRGYTLSITQRGFTSCAPAAGPCTRLRPLPRPCPPILPA